VLWDAIKSHSQPVSRLALAVVAATEENEARTVCSRHGQQPWEVEIRGHDHAAFGARTVKNRCVGSTIEVEFRGVSGVVALLAKPLGEGG